MNKILENYTSFGGHHPETAMVKNVLAYHGVTAPHTGKPFTEAMLFGISGGISSCYILWEFKGENRTSAELVLAFANKANYPVKRMANLCNRVNAKITLKETGSDKLAEKHLLEALQNDIPAIVGVSDGHLPYLHDTAKEYWCFNKCVTVFRVQNDHTLIDDLSEKPFRLSLAELAAARKAIPSYKNRLFLIEPPKEIDLNMAIKAGILDTVGYLSSKSDSFSLPALQKWAKMLIDTKNKKSWPNVFENRIDLYYNLTQIYAGIKYNGTEGAALRSLYADFLEEAATAISQPALQEAADRYRALAELWGDFAEMSLPDKHFRETKEMFTKMNTVFKTEGDAGAAKIVGIEKKLNGLKVKYSADFPMKDAEVAQLFADMQAQLVRIFETEKEALAVLKRAI